MTNCTRKSLPLYSALTLATVGLCSLIINNGPASGARSRYRRVADPHVATASATVTRPTEKQRIVEAYGRLPLSFEANRGQTAAPVKFLARGPGYSLFLTSAETVLALRPPERSETSCRAGLQACIAGLKPSTTDHDSTVGGVIRMRLVGGRPDAPVAGRDELPGRVNYFRGNDPTEWRTDIPTYAKVAYEDVYPGIDLVYYGNQQQLEYDFVVSPGADPHAIRLGFDGADRLDVNAEGDLLLHMANDTLRQRKPVIYQEIDGVRHEVNGGYLLADAAVTFDLGTYDQTRPLVIDPVLVYSTFLGGANMDQGLGIAIDAAGNAYVTGQTLSANFPMQSASDTTLGGASDAVVTKLDAIGSALLYSTYLGGSSAEIGRSIAVDAAGNAYVTGQTFSVNFPTFPTVAPLPFDTVSNGLDDAFVTKLNAIGGLAYSTYLGGSGPDSGFGIAVDLGRNAYVTGQTSSVNFPRMNAFDTSFNGGLADAFVTKLNAAGTALVYSTYLGGGGTDQAFGISVDVVGAVYVTGQTSALPPPPPLPAPPPANFPTTLGAFDDSFNGGTTDAFVTKLNVAGSALDYSTYLGGTGAEAGRGIDLDADGNAYVTGQTFSMNFPTFPTVAPLPFDTLLDGASDAFVTKLNAGGTALVYSTYLGGSGNDQGNGIGVDTAGGAYVTGQTASTNFPTPVGAYDSMFNGPVNGTDAFATKLNAAGSALNYSTYLGGSGNDQGNGIGVDLAGNAYVTGQTFSMNFPTFPTVAPLPFDTSFNLVSDAFVTKFGPPSADVQITKADSPDPVETGTNLTYTLTVTNNGPDAAFDVTVTDVLPAETTFVSCSATGGGVCGGAGSVRTVKYNKLDSGAMETVTLVVTVACSVPGDTAISNTATVSAVEPEDPNASNNVDMETTTASNPPPTITGAAVDKPVLWPPNHKMVDVTVSYDVSDNCGEAGTTCELMVSSNEPQNGTGDGDTDVDWEIVDAHHVRLRAERAGSGSGRVYTITITCTDSGGTSTTQTIMVTVPKSQGKN